MAKSSQDSQTFSNQSALFRIALGANILAWVILVLTVVDLAGIIRQIVQAWPLNLPPNLLDQAAAWVSIFFKFFVDLFYFFVLLGLSQLIYLGIDLYYTRGSSVDEEETEVVVETA